MGVKEPSAGDKTCVSRTDMFKHSLTTTTAVSGVGGGGDASTRPMTAVGLKSTFSPQRQNLRNAVNRSETLSVTDKFRNFATVGGGEINI